MIAPSTSAPFVPFSSEEEKLKYFRSWGLVSAKARSTIPVLYTGFYTSHAVPCEVVGHTWDSTAVISVDGDLHCIDGNYLASIQPKVKTAQRRIQPVGVILSDYIVFDIETTGFDRHFDSIIEISACRYSYNVKQAEYSTLIASCDSIPYSAQKVNHITPDMLRDAPSPEEVSRQFLDFIGTLPLVGHNVVSFDLPFVEAFFSVELNNPVIDTLPFARQQFPGLPSYRLSALADALKLPCMPTHRALQDVEATAALFWACISKVDLCAAE